MPVPPPRNPRELFDIFASYRSEDGLEGMLRNVDLAAVEPRQVYAALHNRAPEKPHFAIPGPGYAPLEHFTRGFRSNEYRNNLIARFLEAFPEKQRLLLIHIPKTAGSELSARLKARYPFLSSQILEPGWGTEDEICIAVRDAVIGLAKSDRLVIGGHNSLERYRMWRAIRYEDRLFTVLRDPIYATLSLINYVLTRIFAQEAQPRPDTLGWRQRFEIQDVAAISKAATIDLAGRILRHTGVVPSNVACRFLGGSTSADAALDRIVCYGVELTDTEHLDAWCRATWGIDSSARSNLSRPYVRYDDFAPADREYLASITAEDAKLYAHVRDRIERQGTPSVQGYRVA
jgi:hypothetical protein